MNASDSNDLESMLDEQAANWLLEREEGFAPGRAVAFAQWCSRDSRHAEAAARVQRTLAILDEMPVVRGTLEARVGKVPAERSRVTHRWAWVAGLAAAVTIAASSWWVIRVSSPDSLTYEVVGTEPRRISLADGSVLDLNAKSRVEVEFSDNERRVTLARGEAHFQVAHNKARPFIVTANGVSVRAVGTAFNVRLAGDKIDVLVSEGKVEVARQQPAALFGTKTTPVIPLLGAGERTQVTVSSDALPRVEEIAPAQVRSLLSWQNRMTSFADVPLSEMVARINRCNSLQLVIGDPQLGDRRVGGVVDLSQVNAFVHLLEQDGDIVSERAPSGEIVLRRAR